MLLYQRRLKSNSRSLRSNLTNSEQLLWSRLRKKQILDIQFYRQKPIGKYIVDFYAPKAKLIIEIDGSQHFEENYKEKDIQRDQYLEFQGLKVMRFDNLQVLKSLTSVLEVIFETLKARVNPPAR